MKRTSLTLVAMIFATGAAAQQYDPALLGGSGVEPEEGSPWSGPYAGAALSSGEGTINLDNYPDELTLGEDETDITTYSFFVGHMMQHGNAVIGGELEYGILDGQENHPEAYSVRDVRLKARLGYDAGPVLPYMTAGLSRAALSLDESKLPEGADPVDTLAADTLFTVGGGVSLKITSNMRLGVEYLHEWTDDFTDLNMDLENSSVGVRTSFEF